ncbi:hypothetical protein RJ641_017157 [Dillenia turbinata]|uniref:Uncharacterized protein n=1 Tax=Dillenia turbinata TaxID=194707 RepID=A0AAN8Z0A2_9MAGN
MGIYRRDFVCYPSGLTGQERRPMWSIPGIGNLFVEGEIVDGVIQCYVSQFDNVHNHELLEDDQVHLLPAYCKIQEADQE